MRLNKASEFKSLSMREGEMETLKNFFIGFVVVVFSLIIISIVSFAWPIIIGLSSILLSILAGIFFVVCIFYIIVVVGRVTRHLLTKK